MIPYDEKVPLPSHRDGQNKIKKSRYFFGRMNIYIYIYITLHIYIHIYNTHIVARIKKKAKRCVDGGRLESLIFPSSLSHPFLLCVFVYTTLVTFFPAEMQCCLVLLSLLLMCVPSSSHSSARFFFFFSLV